MFKKLNYILDKKDIYFSPILILLIITGSFLEMLSVGIVIPVVSALVGEQNTFVTKILNYLNLDFSTDELIIYSLLFLVLIYIFKTFFVLVSNIIVNKFTLNIEVKTSKKLISGYLYAPWPFHLKTNSSTLVRNLNNEVGTLRNNIVNPLIGLSTEVLTVSAILILLLVNNLKITLIIGLVIFFSSFLFMFLTKKKINNWAKIRQKLGGELFKSIYESINGVKEIKITSVENKFIDHYIFKIKHYANIQLKIGVLSILPKLWLENIAIIVLSSLIIFLTKNNNNLSEIIPLISLYAVAAYKIMPSVGKIISQLQSIRYGKPCIDTIYQDLNLINDYQENDNSEKIEFNEKINIENLCINYEGNDKNVLDNCNLEIIKNSCIGILGKTGIGKSTFVDTFMGLLRPNSGSILIDGKNLKLNNKNWQNKIAYVSQSIFLIDDKISKNIAFGVNEEDIDIKKLKLAIEKAQLSEFINSLPLNYETHVGENGVRLSGGQRQRIGIARALYNNRSILILDESTSSLDTTTEKEFINTIKDMKNKKTIIIISHRESVFEFCDKLYSLEKGKFKLKK
jgi:ATP-binding cassette, subfamily B, bacterial PglK